MPPKPTRTGPVRPLALEKQAAFLKAVSERSTVSAIVNKDLSGNVVSWSDGAREIYGYEAQEMLGKTALILHDPESVADGRAATLFAQALIAGKWEGRIPGFRKDGRAFPAQVTALLRRDPAGKPCGLVVVSRDLSEAERIDRELAASQASGENLLDSSAELLILADFAGTISDVNRLTCAIDGSASATWIGASFQEQFSDCARAEELIRQTLLQDEIHGFELIRRLAHGQELKLRCDTLALPGSNGELDRVLIALRPLLARVPVRQIPSVASTSRTQRREPDRVPPAPVPDTRSPVLELSHELSTPLNAIIGFAELLHDGKAGPVALAHREYLGDILTSARHMQRLLNEGLTLGARQTSPVSLSELVAEVRDGLRLIAARKQIDVHLELGSRITLAAEHATKIRQVLYNYLSNALKFTPDGGCVRLRCVGASETSFGFEVEDTGPGIQPERIERLFRACEQLEITADPSSSGSGLGLAISRRLTEELGGQVSVRSAPGKGSVFSAMFPVSSSLAASEPAGSEGRTAESGTRLLAAPARDPKLTDGDGTTLCA